VPGGLAISVSRHRRAGNKQKVDGNVMPVKSRRKPSLSAAHLRLAYSAPAADPSMLADLRRLTMPATKALPFVKLRPNDQLLWRPERYWNVEARGTKDENIELGRSYARAAITAMKADHNTQLIALIVQDIITDAIERTRKRKGRSQAALGFLKEISEAIAAA
jgi:hypothetical protein